MLSQDAYSVFLDAAGVKRADGARLPSNFPSEDRFNRVQPLPLWESETWVAATVFDGHSGWQAADHLEKELLKVVKRKPDKLQLEPRDEEIHNEPQDNEKTQEDLQKEKRDKESRDDEKIQEAIKQSFTELDGSIINDFIACAHNEKMAFKDKVTYAQIANSGSCALLILYDPVTKTLYTACTGDSRAVLGQQESDGNWLPQALSEDQSLDNEAEVARIRAAHKEEPDVVKDGAVLGLRVARAFGNFRWKASHDAQHKLGRIFTTSKGMEEKEIPSPPYLIAEPVVTVRKLGDKPSIIILATDGFWDSVDNGEAVDLVVMWLEAQLESSMEEMKMKLRMAPPTSWWRSKTLGQIEYAPGFDFSSRFHEIMECRFDMRYNYTRTILKDLDNVAVHLLRNACGGNHREFLEGSLAYQAPFSRNIRDDMTVQVLFF
ncbi:phosphatase 2C [Cordyceps militaris]|uniref:Phosphatase 2C n=1 Tax=Cordyceps militaris TaxID=73501 RepID=A0A2H4SHK9_CORMI|nr:phosphatase 2C [Cordyceps militaris]